MADPDSPRDASDVASQAPVEIEVAFALPERQVIVTLTVPWGTTAQQAVVLAELPERFPELPEATFTKASLGIFGKLLREPQRYPVEAGDRVEVYRPLQVDPKEARKQRAAGNRNG
ncbi:RnfH family protein [Litchfieldella xinjiangensis]|uniref:RnfH family protein n=1 Tax=Litchfieldella xinjiangensis TaxID=1166948 RepID=UPI000694419C|nr:RnfH family protein [Halomonas xinjiangensis]